MSTTVDLVGYEGRVLRMLAVCRFGLRRQEIAQRLVHPTPHFVTPVLEDLEAAGFVEHDNAAHRRWSITDAGRKALESGGGIDGCVGRHPASGSRP